MSQNREVVDNKKVLSIPSFLVILTSLRSPMELTENDIRDLILMNGGARDGGGESSDVGGAREASSGGGARGGGGEGGVDSRGEVRCWWRWRTC